MKLCRVLLGCCLALQLLHAENFALRKSARDAIDAGKAQLYLQHQDPEIRRYALYTLCEKDPAKELPALKRAAKDPSPDVRYTVVALLSRLAGKSAGADKLLAELSNDSDAKVRDTACRCAWPFHCDNIRLSEDPSWDYDVKVLQTLPLADDNWKFKTDPDNRGHFKQYFHPEYNDAKWRKIRCGFWENDTVPGYDGYAWYRIRFAMPAKPECNSVELRFTGVDESAWVWLNGKYLGSHDIGLQGYDRPFSLDCRKEILFGRENLLVVRVLDRSQSGGIWKPVFIDILK